MVLTGITQQQNVPLTFQGIKNNDWQKQEASVIQIPLKPMSPEQLQKINAEVDETKSERYAQYQSLLEQAKKAGIQCHDYIELHYKYGLNLSDIKINSLTRTLTCKQKDGTVTMSYDSKGRETRYTSTIPRVFKLFEGKRINSVKTEITKTYPSKKQKVTLKKGLMTSSGECSAYETMSVYTKDKNGKVYKYQEIKYIILDEEPKVSEINYFNPDGTKSKKSKKAWQIK